MEGMQARERTWRLDEVELKTQRCRGRVESSRLLRDFMGLEGRLEESGP